MKFPSTKILLIIICLSFVALAACATNDTYTQPPDVTYTTMQEPTATGVILTVTNITPTISDIYNFQHGELAVTIYNATDYMVQIRDGVSFEINRNGNWVAQSSSATDGNPMFLYPGEKQDVTFNWGVPSEPGEFRLVQEIIIENRRQPAYAYFTIQNPDIPEDKADITLSFYKSTPTSVALIAINGFREGNVYIDGIYTIQCINGEDVTPITSIDTYDPRRAQQRIVGARQNQMFTVHWGWLYGMLPPGEYVIWKTINHRAYEGNGVWRETLTDIPVQFIVTEGEYVPNPSPNTWYFGWHGEATGILAEVNSSKGNLIDWLGPTLLVTALRCPDGWMEGDQFYIGRPAGAVLDANGIPMPFDSIPEGAIIKFTFDGIVLTSKPGIIGGTIEIRVLE